LVLMHERAKANRRAAQPRQGGSTLLFDRLSERLQPEERLL
jgi:hypothetical protein